MRKLILSSICILFSLFYSSAQTNYQLAESLDFFKSHKMQTGDWMQTIAESDIEGSPYLNNEFIRGSIYTYQKMQFNDIPLRFNIYTGNLEFKTPEDQILALAAPEIVEKAVFGDFKMSYVPYILSKKIKNGFLRVIEEGTVSLYAQPDIFYQKPKEAAAYKDAEPAKFLERPDAYFIRIGKEAAIKFNNKKELISIFTDHNEEVAIFIKKNKIKISKEKSLQELVKYCNTL